MVFLTCSDSLAGVLSQYVLYDYRFGTHALGEWHLVEPRKSTSFYGLCSKYFLRGSMRNRELEFDFGLFEAQMVAGIFGYWSRLIFIESRNLHWSLWSAQFLGSSQSSYISLWAIGSCFAEGAPAIHFRVYLYSNHVLGLFE